MRIRQLAVITLCSSTLAVSPTLLGASPGNGAKPSFTEGLFPKDHLTPSPATVFLNNSAEAKVGSTPTALGAALAAPDDGPNGTKKVAGPLMLSDCETLLDDEDLIIYGGGAVDGLGSNSASDQGSGQNSSSIDPIGVENGANNNAPNNGAGLPGGSGFAGGGSSNGGQAGIPNAGATNGGTGNSTPDSIGNANSDTGSSSSPASGTVADGSSALDKWHVIPVGLSSEGGGPISSDGGTSTAAHLPLPAPLWMAIAGLSLVVLLRRRVLP